MKTSLRRILCLALGLAAAHVPAAFSQELEFHPVPRPTAPAASAMPLPPAPAQDAVSIGAVVPASYVAGRIVNDTLTFVDDPMKIPAAPVMPSTPMPTAPPTSGVPRQMPPMAGDWTPPPPGTQILAPMPGMVVTQPTIVSQPTIVGQPTIVSPGSTSYVVSGGDSGSSCGSCGSCCDSCGMQTLRSPTPIWDHLFGSCGSGNACGSGCNDGCDPCGCNSCGCCGPRSMFWVRAEYMVYAITRQNGPPLVTSAPTVAQLPIGAGSTVLFDGQSLPHSPFSGGKFNVGFWFPNHSDFGLDVTAFFLSQRQTNFTATSDGSFAIGRPYFETSTAPANAAAGLPAAPTNTNQAEITAGPGAGTGSINVLAQTRIWGFDPDLRAKLLCGPTWWIDGLAGYRYFRLDDSIGITENIFPNAALGNAAHIVVQDNFAARNTFNGAELGLDGEWRFRPRWSLGGSFKLAIGDVTEQVRINGSTTATLANGTVQQFPAGFFALPSNIGNFQQNRFAVLPEFGARLNFDVTEHLRIYAGFSAMYLSNVVRAGDQIDTRINSSQAPIATPGAVYGPPLPAVLFKRTDFWAQGVNIGLEYHY